MCLTDPINAYLRGNRKRGTDERGPLGHDHQLAGGRARPDPRPRTPEHGRLSRM